MTEVPLLSLVIKFFEA